MLSLESLSKSSNFHLYKFSTFLHKSRKVILEESNFKLFKSELISASVVFANKFNISLIFFNIHSIGIVGTSAFKYFEP